MRPILFLLSLAGAFVAPAFAADSAPAAFVDQPPPPSASAPASVDPEAEKTATPTPGATANPRPSSAPVDSRAASSADVEQPGDATTPDSNPTPSTAATTTPAAAAPPAAQPIAVPPAAGAPPPPVAAPDMSRAAAPDPSAELAAKTRVLEDLLAAQREHEIVLYRIIVAFAVGFALVGLAALAAAAYLNFRGLAAAQSVALSTVEPPAPPAASLPGGSRVPGIERVQASGQRFQSRMSSLEERLAELEELAGRESRSPNANAPTGAGELAAPPLTNGASEAHFESMGAPLPVRVIPRGAILVHKAQAQSHLGKYTEALATLTEAAGLDGDSAEIQLARGQVLEKLGRLADALRAYDQAVTIDESNTNALLMKAGVLNRQERFAEALACYERALEVHRANN